MTYIVSLVYLGKYGLSVSADKTVWSLFTHGPCHELSVSSKRWKLYKFQLRSIFEHFWHRFDSF